MTDPPTKSLEEIKAEARRYALATTKVQKPPYAPAFLAPAAAPDPAAAAKALDEAATKDDRTNAKEPVVKFFDEDYLRFVLGLNEGQEKLLEDDDDEFQLDSIEEEEDLDDDDEDPPQLNDPSTALSKSEDQLKEDFLIAECDMDWDIHQELGWLQEDEDMDFNLTNLVHEEVRISPEKKDDDDDMLADVQWVDQMPGLANTQHDRTNPPMPTTLQQEKLRSLLKRHYQLLIQQGIMAVRLAHSDKRKIKGPRSHSGHNTVQKNGIERSVIVEGADDLIEIVDSAVGKLIDLRQQRQDSFRTILAPQQDTLLTRAQFRKVKETVEGLHTMTLFDVPGLDDLDNTFASIDQSVHGLTADNNILYMDKVRSISSNN